MEPLCAETMILVGTSSTPKIHSPDVTSNLVLYTKSAHHGQGGGGAVSRPSKGPKSFVLKIVPISSLKSRLARIYRSLRVRVMLLVGVYDKCPQERAEPEGVS